jgi:hypothetical protein
MLRKLVLHKVGPTEHLALDPVAPRLNLITGDNGLGKSFLLDAAWWALTRTWHDTIAVPSAPNAKIEHHFDGAGGISKEPSTWDPLGQYWKRTQGRPANPGLVLYARVDGSFSVWDPARNYRLYRRQDGGEQESPRSYQFSSGAALWGLKRSITLGGRDHEETLCLGLIDEWREWQRAADPRFNLLRQILEHLGPDNEPLTPGELRQPTPDDQRVIPTIRMPYGQDVPITYAPAGVKRMAKLAYLFAWGLSSHLDEVTRQIGGGQKTAPANQVIVLVDEPETHLHPRWQRTVLPSLVRAVETGWGGWKPRVQFLVATHSPLVLASMEPMFDPSQDALWKLDLAHSSDGGAHTVVIEKDRAYRRGDAAAWLRSDVFDGTSPYSKEAEDAINRAMALLRRTDATKDEIRAVTDALRCSLSETDRIWTRWAGFARDHGVEA